MSTVPKIVARSVCPKCGFAQTASAECMRCGIIFERYKRRQSELPWLDSGLPMELAPRPGLIRRLYRIFRWVTLVSSVVIILLILRPSAPPQIATDPEAALRLDSKLRELRVAGKPGRSRRLHLNEAELNVWLNSNLALARKIAPVRPLQVDASRTPEKDAAGTPPKPEPTVSEVQSTVRDVKIQLFDDRLSAYVLFDFHGKDLSLLLEGQLSVQDGYLSLAPTHGKLGSLPLPQSTLESAARRLFESPENKEKFRLPAQISDIRIVDGELILSYR